MTKRNTAQSKKHCSFLMKSSAAFMLLLGGCAGSDTAARKDISSESPPAVLSATVIECIYQQGCRPLSP